MEVDCKLDIRGDEAEIMRSMQPATINRGLFLMPLHAFDIRTSTKSAQNSRSTDFNAHVSRARFNVLFGVMMPILALIVI